MKDSLLIQNAWIIDPVSKKEFLGDLLIEEGKISAIDVPGKIPSKKAKKCFDATGCWLTPGLVDVHVHLREPGHERKETIESGTLAAVAGGFTSVACMANTEPVNDCAKITAFIRDRAKEKAACKVFPIGAVTQGLKGERLADVAGMVKEGAIALSDDGMPVMNSFIMKQGMDLANQFGITIISHAEDANLVANHIRTSVAEEIMVAREIALCRLTRARVHIAHLSTREGLDHVRRAKEAGLPVTAEVTPHHLILNQKMNKSQDTNYKMAPPLRLEEDTEALRVALATGLVDMIATDHAPHGEEDKKVEYSCAANGIIGLQTAAPSTLDLVRDGVVSKMRWVQSLTTEPARLLQQKIGTLALGSDADITLIDPSGEWSFDLKTNRSLSQNSPLLNKVFKAKVVATIVQGEVVYQNARNLL